jgi:CobQ-like glutamine amidotransferase family enzyme
MAGASLTVAVLFPELLGTYGDGGNGLVLRRRAEGRGVAVRLVEVGVGAALPAQADIYLLGGGEDDAQVEAARRLRDGTLERAVRAGAVLLAVCAGLQLVGRVFTGSDGRRHEGVGLLDADTVAGSPRAVGDLAVEPDPVTGLPVLLGYENHGGRTTLDPPAAAGGSAPTRPLGRAVRGVGNGSPVQPRAEGALAEPGSGFVLATYLHGPVLAQNPALADLLLARALGVALAPLADPHIDAATARLRRDRLASLRL